MMPTNSANPSTCQQQDLNQHQEGVDTSLISKYKQSNFMKHFGFVFLFVALVIMFLSGNRDAPWSRDSAVSQLCTMPCGQSNLEWMT